MKHIVVQIAEFDSEAVQNRFLAYFQERIRRMFDPKGIPEGFSCGVWVPMDGRLQDRFIAQLDVFDNFTGTLGQLDQILAAWTEEQQTAREGTDVFHRVPLNVTVD